MQIVTHGLCIHCLTRFGMKYKVSLDAHLHAQRSRGNRRKRRTVLVVNEERDKVIQGHRSYTVTPILLHNICVRNMKEIAFLIWERTACSARFHNFPCAVCMLFPCLCGFLLVPFFGLSRLSPANHPAIPGMHELTDVFFQWCAKLHYSLNAFIKGVVAWQLVKSFELFAHS